MLLVAPCYRNRDRLLPCGPPWLLGDITLPTCLREGFVLERSSHSRGVHLREASVVCLILIINIPSYDLRYRDHYYIILFCLNRIERAASS